MGVGVGTVAYNQVKLGTATVWTFNVLLLVFLLFSDEFKKKKSQIKNKLCALMRVLLALQLLSSCSYRTEEEKWSQPLPP